MEAGSSTVSFTGLSSAMTPSFSLAKGTSSSAVGFEHEIVRDHHTDRETRADGDGRLDAERAADHLLAGLVDALRRPLLDRFGKRAVAVAAHAGLRPDAEDGREDRGLEQHAPVVVDLVLQAGIAFRIGAGLALQDD